MKLTIHLLTHYCTSSLLSSSKLATLAGMHQTSSVMHVSNLAFLAYFARVAIRREQAKAASLCGDGNSNTLTNSCIFHTTQSHDALCYSALLYGTYLPQEI